ncbi:hypothetical protein HL658_35675 [Azospirillum sp. RWY-5-1]|uniref:Uncharacterized protein n=1 Tax=Azospirillum oleiclasticum TaxID=2735135 RepID=A0ABX2TN38_9PROT|nr:hypothetical protein [Azospirillum oleiclasticum]NYZ17912.1 hypothetical protein [Azospirillum oleiclasticum]NYZ25113.1 hypothetical protein [Azospirillum oleiclasticum]
MALVKAIPTDFGIDATYWHIHAIDIARPQRAVQVTMAGYIDADARRGGRRPIASLTLQLAGDRFPGTIDGIAYAAIYERLATPGEVPDDGDPTGWFVGAAEG